MSSFGEEPRNEMRLRLVGLVSSAIPIRINGFSSGACDIAERTRVAIVLIMRTTAMGFLSFALVPLLETAGTLFCNDVSTLTRSSYYRSAVAIAASPGISAALPTKLSRPNASEFHRFLKLRLGNSCASE